LRIQISQSIKVDSNARFILARISDGIEFNVLKAIRHGLECASRDAIEAGLLRWRIATGNPPPAATVPSGFFLSSETLAITSARTVCGIVAFPSSL
jgi:hypothetical protein